MTSADLAQGYDVDWGGHIAEATNFSFAFTADQVDVTNHDSADRTREFIAGLISPSECTITVNYIPSSHDAIIANAGDSSTVETLALTRPAADGGFSMDAWVKGYSKNGSATGDADTLDITFQITGPISTGAS
jgi:predicted secreted protein